MRPLAVNRIQTKVSFMPKLLLYLQVLIFFDKTNTIYNTPENCRTYYNDNKRNTRKKVTKIYKITQTWTFS